MPSEFKNSTGMLIFQMIVCSILIVVFGWLYLGPKHVHLNSWEMMLYFGFFPAFVIYDGLRLMRRLRAKS